MLAEKAKASIADLSREELLALLYELTNRVRQLVKQLRLKQAGSLVFGGVGGRK